MDQDNHRQQPSAGTQGKAERRDNAICPFCGSRETEQISPFASQLSTAQYICRACHSPFERIRQDEPPTQ